MTITALSVSSALTDAAVAMTTGAGTGVVRVGRHGGRGCGVVVADGFVVTNSHNLRDRTTEITFADGRTDQGSVVGVDVDGDLVAVAVDTTGATPVAWSDEPPQTGGLVFAVVRTPGGGLRITVGALSSVDGAFRGPRGRPVTGTLEHTAPLARGSSGSPLLDGGGRLIGLNTARLGGAFYAAIPADAHLRSRIDALLRGESPQRRSLGVGLAAPEAAAKLRAAVGLPDRAGLLVRSVEPDSAAARADIRVGDLVVTAGGAAVVSVDDLQRAIDAPEAAAGLELTLVRGADEMTVTVGFDPAESASPS